MRLTGCRENVQHKNSIKVLRDEITSLKEELLEVKHANRILSGQLNALGPGHRFTHLNVSPHLPINLIVKMGKSEGQD